ncbi:MAG: NADH-quinone oxidoreductase subunit N [Gemmatimonadota bacterium]
MPVGDIVPELVLIGGAVTALLWALFVPRRLQRGSALLALTALAIAAGSSAAQLAPGQTLTFFSTWAIDDAAIWGKFVIMGIAAVTIAFSVDWFRDDPRHGEFYTLLLLSTLGAVVLASAADTMELILGVLLSSATGYVLAGYHRRSPESAEAAIKYYLLGGLASGAMMYGAVLLFGLAATTTLAGMATSLSAVDPLPLVVGASLFVVGLLFKLGAVPAHAWMPDVADGSPAPSAAFLTAAPKVGALIALGRLVLVLPEDGAGWRWLVAAVAAATMTLGNLAALWQEDVRRLLGWSAVSQSGYALMAVAALGRSTLAVPALLLFLVAYVLGNLAAFGVVAQLRGLRRRSDYAGLGRSRPWLAGALLLAFLSFVGIPPLVGFAGKLSLFAAAIEAGYAWLAILAVANTVVSLVYYLRVLAPAYLDRPAASAPSLGVWAAAGTLACAAGIVAAGIGAEALLRRFATATLLPGGG